MLALLGGEVDLLSSGFGETRAFLDSDDVRVLGLTAAERLATYPDLPTLRELGQDVVITNWRGVFGPPGLTPEATQRWIALCDQLVASAAWRAAIARNGWVDEYTPGAAFTAYLDAQERQLKDTLTRMGFLR
jgi:putative tricarboxylic transport membrane protein